MAQSFGFAAFKKAGKFYFLQSSQNIRERGNQLSLFIYPKLMESFGLLLKMRCIFFTEQPYTDQGAPLDPLCRALWHRALFCGTELGFCTQIMAQSFGLWHRALFCGTELCFRRLCNFDLPNKQRFSLQRHKSCKKLRFLRYSACAEFLDSLL